MENRFNLPFLWDTFWVALSGVPTTLLLTIVSLGIAVPVSLFLAIIRMKKIPVIHHLIRMYVSFIRGTPIIIQIFLVYSSMPLILGSIFKKYEIGIQVYNVNPIWYGFVVFTFNTTALLIEVFRSSLATVDKGQLEAAQSVGLSEFQAYYRIIIPQAIVSAIPNLSTATINLIKATSLGYAMSIQEITLRAKVAANVGYNYVEAYLDILFVYVLLCMMVEYLFKKYEQYASKYKPTHAT